MRARVGPSLLFFAGSAQAALEADASWTAEADRAAASFGCSVAAAGDVNG